MGHTSPRRRLRITKPRAPSHPMSCRGSSASSTRVLLSGAGSAAGHRRPGGGTRSDMAKRSTARRNASCVTTRSCAATARILRASGTIRRQCHGRKPQREPGPGFSYWSPWNDPNNPEAMFDYCPAWPRARYPLGSETKRMEDKKRKFLWWKAHFFENRPPADQEPAWKRRRRS